MWKAGILFPRSVSSHMLTSCFLYVGGGGQNAIWFTVFDAMFPIAYCAKAHTSDDGGSWRNEAPPHGKKEDRIRSNSYQVRS